MSEVKNSYLIVVDTYSDFNSGKVEVKGRFNHVSSTTLPQ